jgi:TatD DNase family protein
MTTKAVFPAAELVDTHCHVDLYPDPGPLLTAAATNRVLVVAVTNAPSVFFHTQRLSERYPYLLPAVGLHPELVATHGHEVDRILPLLEQTQFVGEVGLDYVTTDESLRARQRNVFTKILDRCSALGGKVITVHSRRSASDVIAAVGERFNGTVILHWFSGTTREADRALKAGCYFSINTAMLSGKSSSQLLAALPQDRVLTETDGPFISSGKVPVTPLETASVASHLASLWRTTDKAAREILMANFVRLTNRN